MERRQARMFEGIRFSIQMADVAHSRLRENLLELTDAVDPPHKQVGAALEDAWSIIDSASRLRGILRQTPGIPRRDHRPSIRKLERELGPSIEKRRNVFQHLENDVGQRTFQNWPLFGILHWFRLNADGDSGRICSLMPGSLAEGPRPLMNTYGKRIYDYEAPLGMIELQTEPDTVSISDLMENLRSITVDLEGHLARLPGNRLPCDSIFLTDIRFIGEADVRVGQTRGRRTRLTGAPGRT